MKYKTSTCPLACPSKNAKKWTTKTELEILRFVDSDIPDVLFE